MNINDLDVEIFDSDDDEEIIMYIERSYTVRNRPNLLNKWNDQEFYDRFRLSKERAQSLFLELGDFLQNASEKNNAVPPMLQLLLCIRFYATGNMYTCIGDSGGIHKSTFAKIIRKVTQAIVTLFNNYVFMPRNDEEVQKKVLEFYNIARFPTVIGAIDGTHVRIISPGGADAENFRNRKGYFSLNCQAVCDANYKIQDLVVRWPGSTHDSTIFDHSNLKTKLERNDFNDTVLLGDSAYPLKKYLMTPLLNPNSQAENLYNQSHISTRTTIERCFGIWKRRFPVLSVGMRCQTRLAQKIIIATAILHNIAQNEKDWEDDIPEAQDETLEELEANRTPNNEQMFFINYFQNLINN